MKYFTIEEFCKSEAAVRLGIKNVPTGEAVANLERLAAEILDPLREAWGGPVYVNSGYRCRMLNDAVGGSRTSQHMQGLAADVTVGSVRDNRRLAETAVKLGLPFDQLINEHNWQWVHISAAPKGRLPRHDMLKTAGNGYARIKL